MLLVGERITDVQFLVAGAVKLFKSKYSNKFEEGGRSGKTFKRRFQATRNSGGGGTQAQRFLNSDQIVFDTEAFKIHHNAPDVQRYYFVKKVLVGDVLDFPTRGGNRSHVFTAWSTVESCIYSISIDAIQMFKKGFPHLNSTLKDAFKAMLSEQSRRTNKAVLKSTLEKMCRQVKKLDLDRVSRAQNPSMVRVDSERGGTLDGLSKLARPFSSLASAWWVWPSLSHACKVSEFKDTDEMKLNEDEAYEQAPIIHADATIMENISSRRIWERAHSFQNLPLPHREKRRARSFSFSGTEPFSTVRNSEQSAETVWLNSAAKNFPKFNR